jgi:hypothetical protein
VVRQQSQTISIGRATGEDAPQILACRRAAFEEYRRLYTPAAFLDTVLTPETILVRLAKFFVFVAVSDSSEVVGTIACNILSAEEGPRREIWLSSFGKSHELLWHALKSSTINSCQ